MERKSDGRKQISNHPTVKQGQETRKQRRKKERLQKKALKAKRYSNFIQKRKSIAGINRLKSVPGRFVRNYDKSSNNNEIDSEILSGKSFQSGNPNDETIQHNIKEKGVEGSKPSQSKTKILNKVAKDNFKDKRRLKKIQLEMIQNRKKTLLEANEEEDKIIKDLEKQLKLDKRKSKSLPASFASSGLDYILDICNPDKIQSVIETEKKLVENNDNFDEDFRLVTGSANEKNKKRSSSTRNVNHLDDNFNFDNFSGDTDSISSCSEESLGNFVDDFDVGDDSSEDSSDTDIVPTKVAKTKNHSSISQSYLKEKNAGNSDSGSPHESHQKKSNPVTDSECEQRNQSSIEDEIPVIRKKSALVKTKSLDVGKKKKKVSFSKPQIRYFTPDPEDLYDDDDNTSAGLSLSQLDSDDSDSSDDSVCFEELLLDSKNTNDPNSSNLGSKSRKISPQELWEDIYGRKRDKFGQVIEEKVTGKYLPPHLRIKSNDADAKKKEELERLRKLMKGLINRLAESNMHSISSQIEDLYMKNSRNNMNETLTALIMEVVVSPVITPERLILEHAMLCAILHANVGTEVGAFILQQFVKTFSQLLVDESDVSNKKLDNTLMFISHLYTFKIFDCSLLYDILGELCAKFTEKEVELILVVLRSVGFVMRKDNPIALKELVLKVQKLANDASVIKESSRVRFMLDVLMTIKNNNMSKLPQYDPSLVEHLKSLLKPMIRKGNYVSELKISYNDLLNADEQGRWWIVGSAWSGSTPQLGQNILKTDNETAKMSENLMNLAKKLRISTDSRKNIFSILMTAEDCNDAFEKLVKLGLKGHLSREIIYVLIHCLLSEKEYNPYYMFVSNRFCQADRKYQMTIQCTLWDKFKEVDSMKNYQITNLAKFIAHLFIEGALPLSVLKVIEFVNMSKPSVRLVRQILLALLCHKEESEVSQVFSRVAGSSKLGMFRESMRLFLHHFLLKNMKGETDKEFLRARINLADRLLQPVG